MIVGFVVVGMAVALVVFIQYLARELHAPEDIPRAVAIPALYATVGALAITGAIQRRPAIIVAAGVLCLVGTMPSVRTLADLHRDGLLTDDEYAAKRIDALERL